jgi:hypothetical protein
MEQEAPSLPAQLTQPFQILLLFSSFFLLFWAKGRVKNLELTRIFYGKGRGQYTKGQFTYILPMKWEKSQL